MKQPRSQAELLKFMGPATTTKGNVSEHWSILKELLSFYRTQRLKGLDLEEVDPEIGRSTVPRLYNALWQARKPLSGGRRNEVFKVLLQCQKHTLQSTNCVYRPEFAFITAWTESTDWAEPLREQLETARNGLPFCESCSEPKSPSAPSSEAGKKTRAGRAGQSIDTMAMSGSISGFGFQRTTNPLALRKSGF